MAPERVFAAVTLTSRSGLSIYQDLERFSLERLDDFLPEPDHIDPVANRLKQAGFEIEARTEVGLTMSGRREHLEAGFGVEINRRTINLNEPRLPHKSFPIYESSRPSMMSDRIRDLAETVRLVRPGVPFHRPEQPGEGEGSRHPAKYVPDRLNVVEAHANGITGAGVRISLVDNGDIAPLIESQAYDIDGVRSVGGLDLQPVEDDHPASIAAHLLAAAPVVPA